MTYKTLKPHVIILLFLGVMTYYTNTSAHTGDVLSSYSTVTPTLDGVISPGEWDDADTVTFNFSIPLGSLPVEFHDATLYVKNDDTTLYLAWVIKNEDYDPSSGLGGSSDLARFHFDNDHDGLREVGDDAINCFPNTICRDDFLENTVTFGDQIDILFDGSADVLGASSHTNPVKDAIGDYTFEVSHPLNTLDDAHDFSLLGGDTVGVRFTFFDEGIGAGLFPSLTANFPGDASNWADIVIAQQITQDPGPHQSPQHRQIHLNLPSFTSDTPPSPFGSISITRRNQISCNEVRIQVANLVPRPAGSVFTVYLDTDTDPFFPILSFNTGGFTQSDAIDRFFCGEPFDEVFVRWLDPNQQIRAYIVKEAVVGPQLEIPSFCTDFNETDCFILINNE